MVKVMIQTYRKNNSNPDCVHDTSDVTLENPDNHKDDNGTKIYGITTDLKDEKFIDNYDATYNSPDPHDLQISDEN